MDNKDSMTMFFDNGMVIITENADGEIYLIKAKNIREILTDWNGDCNFVPSNDARVFFACWNGEPINPYGYTNFESLIQYLRYLQIK